jgi:hypothetical protein
MDRRPAACAEFPNDNPALHDGAIWWCAEPCAPARFEQPRRPAADRVLGGEGTCVLDDDDVGDIEIVDELPMLEAVDEVARAPANDEVATLEALGADLRSGALDVDHSPSMKEPMADLISDPFHTLVRVMEEVASAAGAGEEALKRLRALLGRSRLEAGASEQDRTTRAQALAWKTILRGEGDAFDACGGAMLDDWASALIARVLGQPGRTDGIKRELRKKGVAAFGIVEQAA